VLFYNSPNYSFHSAFFAYNAAIKDDENESQADESIEVGKMVKHPQFGLGEIRAIEGRSANTKLTIDFEKVGVKKILIKFGNLQVL